MNVYRRADNDCLSGAAVLTELRRFGNREKADGQRGVESNPSV